MNLESELYAIIPSIPMLELYAIIPSIDMPLGSGVGLAPLGAEPARSTTDAASKGNYRSTFEQVWTLRIPSRQLALFGFENSASAN